MDDCAVSDLAARDVLVVTSTFGDGDPPDNGADFWDRLRAPDAPDLHGLRFAVLGIGDRSYGQFCGHARSLDTRLAELGGARLLDRSDCEVHDEDSLTTWAQRVIELVNAGESAPAVFDAPTVTRPAEPFTRANPVARPVDAEHQADSGVGGQRGATAGF